MKLATVAELKNALHQVSDDTPLEVVTTEGNVYTHAEWMTVDGGVRLTLERTLELTAEETVFELNRELVEAAPEPTPRNRARKK